MKKFAYVTFLILVSCNSNNENSANIIEVDLRKEESLSLSTILDSITYIQFDGASNILLGDIHRIDSYKDNYYFQEKMGSRISKFDSGGKLTEIINNQGRGPGEYISISLFCVNNSLETIDIIDNNTLQLLRYNLDGSYRETVKLNQYVREVYCLKDYYLFYTPDKNLDFSRGLWISDFSGSFIKQLHSFDDKSECAIPDRSLFPISDTSYGFINDYDDYVYKFDSDKIEKGLKFIFSNQKSTSAMKYSNLPPHKAYYFENSRFIIFTYLSSSTNKLILYDKLNKSVKIVSKIINDIDGILGRPIIGGEPSSLYFSVDPILFSKKGKSRSDNISDNTNPILQVWHTKK